MKRRILLAMLVLCSLSCDIKKWPRDNPLDPEGTNYQVPETPVVADPGETAAYGAEYALTWKKSERAKSYTVQESADHSFKTPATVYSDSSTAKFIHTVKTPTTYSYRVMANNGDYTSGWSNTVDMTVYPAAPAPPGELQAKDIQTTSLTLTWKDSSDNEEGFRIERKDPGGDFQEIAVVNENTVTYSITGLSSGVSYAFRVRAYNVTGNSDYSPEITAKTKGFFTISGKISGAAGVTVTLSGDRSDAQTVLADGGSYSFTVVEDGSFTVTPSKTGYVFSPASQTFANVTANRTQDFTAVKITYILSGKVTGADGVTVVLSGDKTEAQTVNSGGSYSFIVPYGGSYTVTPSKTGYTFTPSNKVFTNVTANRTQDFTATKQTFTLSVIITGVEGLGIWALKVILSGDASGSQPLNSSGTYSFTVSALGTYTVTPSLAGWVFTPASYTFTNVTANQTQNFTARQYVGRR